MAQEIDLGGTIYISSKRAAEITGYTQDYIGQLARSEQIAAQRISGLWYVVEQSLQDYKARADEFKPEPPKPTSMPDIESSVSFDGKDYVSAQRAAKITGYHQDYVGQLARSGKILSRQVGNRWYVDREALVEHKKHNDALLAAVQTESVGLARTEAAPAPQEEDLHFKYLATEEASNWPPLVQSRQGDINENNDISDEIERVPEINEIPIRVIRPRTLEKMPATTARFQRSLSSYRSSGFVSILVGITIIGLLGIAGGYVYTMHRPWVVTAQNQIQHLVRASISHTPSIKLPASIKVPDFIKSRLTKELYYRRDDF